MSDDDEGPSLAHKGFLGGPLGHRVEMTGRFVEQHDGCPAQVGPGQRDQLLFAS